MIIVSFVYLMTDLLKFNFQLLLFHWIDTSVKCATKLII